MSWVLLAFTGGLLLFVVRHTSHHLVESLLVRGAALCFMAAGVVGASGWLGSLLKTTTGWFVSLTNTFGSAAVGVGIAWMFAVLVTIAWVMGFLPSKWVRLRLSESLVLGGLVFPPMLASVPGQAGSTVRELVQALGHATSSTVAGLWS